jgi:hypothetical protein
MECESVTEKYVILQLDTLMFVRKYDVIPKNGDC